MAGSRVAALRDWGPAIAVVILGVFSVWFVCSLFLSALKIGTLADYAQTISSLFTAVAVVIALISLYLQRKHFETQIAQLQGSTVNKTFQMLIEVHNSTIHSLSYDGKSGLDRLREHLSNFENTQFPRTLIRGLNAKTIPKSTDNYADGSIHSEYSHYLNVGILILQFINQCDPSSPKKLYIDIFIAKLARPELILLMYHIALSGVADDLKDFANTYSLFKTIQEETNENTILKKHYLPSAFGLTQWTHSE